MEWIKRWIPGPVPEPIQAPEPVRAAEFQVMPFACDGCGLTITTADCHRTYTTGERVCMSCALALVEDR